jgi:pimeloyl-ACP methyl ester carboxylesterase
MTEQAVVFGADKSLVGIVTEPTCSAESRPLPAIIILNAGLLHRVGPNRLHVKLARAMASAGFLALRFDFSGVGDSPARMDRGSIDEGVVRETQEAVDFLEHTFGVRRVILLGLCSGADTAFRTACREPRVAGVIGINGSYLEESQKGPVQQYLRATTQERYYRRQLLSPRKWWRCATGKSNLRQLIRFLRTRARARVRRIPRHATATGFPRKCHELIDRGVHLLLVYSEGSTSLDALRSVHGQTPKRLHFPPALEVQSVENVDHVFTLLWAQQALVDTVKQWARGHDRCWMSDHTTSAAGERLCIAADGGVANAGKVEIGQERAYARYHR